MRRLMKVTGAAAVAVALFAVGIVAFAPNVFDRAIQEVTLPLRHADIIRQQSEDKDVDASLIAGVIYAESRFRDQVSHAGARGLMQITPYTARHIERESGGTDFVLDDLSDPDINIRYGSFYLRELLDLYGGREVPALAAYNAGPTQAEKWGGESMSIEDITWPETRGYVVQVLEKRAEYRQAYAAELGY